MTIELAAPALLFPAISLLMLAYTNRYLSLANLIRSLYDSYAEDRNENVARQIANLRRRLWLIKHMQLAAVSSITLCIICMVAVLAGAQAAALVLFAAALLAMLGSLVLSLREIWISTDALNIALDGLA